MNFVPVMNQLKNPLWWKMLHNCSVTSTLIKTADPIKSEMFEFCFIYFAQTEYSGEHRPVLECLSAALYITQCNLNRGWLHSTVQRKMALSFSSVHKHVYSSQCTVVF